MGAPYWDQYARGSIIGLTRGSKKAHIIRAAVESLAYQVLDLIKAMEKTSSIKLSELKVDGGASANDFLMQFQADILNAAVKRPKCIETTALGASYLAGLATGYYKSKEDIKKNWMLQREFKPEMEEKNREKIVSGWHKAVKRSLHWEEEV
ncbi:glycerol kinase [Acetitomaculum ruminis DSM 5522]|uniref:Glycerol kinase n=1 Tax=Acetitomaculum ruminis DSM 5522 TaxID=1120918 RepID=A0A1I0XP41_9FIRM|nr:glycerol kinase [Acetitomaculum ruminis DSM 5522]